MKMQTFYNFTKINGKKQALKTFGCFLTKGVHVFVYIENIETVFSNNFTFR